MIPSSDKIPLYMAQLLTDRQKEILLLEFEAKKVKRNLELWREFILPLSSILLWEKYYYLGIIVSVTTVGFLLLWHIDPSFLTVLSVIGLIVTAVDYMAPILAKRLFPPDNWTSDKERKLESICQTLAENKIFVSNLRKSFYQRRLQRSKVLYFVVITTLLFLSWIGSAVNNLFLTYLFVNALLLVPGVQHRGLIEKCTLTFSKRLYNFLGITSDEEEEEEEEYD